MVALLDNVNRIYRVAEALANRSSVADGDGAWMAGALIRFLEGENFEVAVGLPRTGTPWRKLAAQATRNDLFATLSERFFPGATARAIAAAVKRYATTNWPREQALSGPRPATIGTANELLWRIHRLGGVPKSAKQIRRILEGTSGGASNVPRPVLLSVSINEADNEFAPEKERNRPRHSSPTRGA